MVGTRYLTDTRVTIQSLSPRHREAAPLISELDAALDERYPEHRPHQFDGEAFEKAGGYFVLAKNAGAPVGCGGFRPIDVTCAEIKRMYVRPDARRHGIARRILHHLEREIRRHGFLSIVLETGIQQPEAIAFYLSEGFFPIPTFLGYVGNPNSRCFAKKV